MNISTQWKNLYKLNNKISYGIIFLLLLLPFFLLIRFTDGHGLDAHDYAIYLLHTQALIEGRNYTDIGFIFNEYNSLIANIGSPPGLPLSILILFILFGHQLLFIKVMILGFTLLFFYFCTKYFYEFTPKFLALIMLLILSTLPLMTSSATHIMTDVPFCAFTWMTIYFIDKRKSWTWSTLLLVTLFGSLAILFRIAGIVLIPTLFVYMILNFKNLDCKPILTLIVWSLVFCIMAYMIPIFTATTHTMNMESVFNLTNIQDKIFKLRWMLLDIFLNPFSSMISYLFFITIGCFLMTIGCYRFMYNAPKSFLTSFFLLYSIFIMTLPDSPLSRFFMVLFPFYIFIMLYGLSLLFNLLSIKNWMNYAMIMLFGLFMSSVGYYQSYLRPQVPDLADLPDAKSLFKYVKNNFSANNTRIAFAKPSVLTLNTGISSIGFADIKPENLYHLYKQKNINYIILENPHLHLSHLGHLDARKLILNYPDNFIKLYQNNSFELYKIKEQKLLVRNPTTISGSQEP